MSAIPAGEGTSLEHSASGDVAPRARGGERRRDRAQLLDAARAGLPRARRSARSSRRVVTATAPSPARERRSPAARAGSPSPTEQRRASCATPDCVMSPILAMGALSPVELAEALSSGCDVLVWSEEGVARVAGAGGGRVHVKLDTGMGRLGTRDREVASRAVSAAVDTPGVELAGVMTHFATADERDDEGFFSSQLAAFTELGAAGEGREPGRHRPRSEQRGDAPRPRRTLRHGPLRDRDLRDGSLRRRPAASRGSRPRSSFAPTLPRSRRAREGESVGYGRRFISRAPDEHRRDTRRLRRWLEARPLGQRARADRRGELPAGRHRQHGLVHGRSRRRPGGVAPARRARDPDRIRRRGSASPRRRSRSALRRSTTRSPAG